MSLKPSNVSKGNRAEKRAKAILKAMGFELAAEAKGRPVWKAGRVIANDGATDLLKNSFDQIYIKKGRRTLFVQVCHIGGESPRRQKMRNAGLDPAFHEGLLLAWDLDAGCFQAYRDVDDYLKGPGWAIRPDAKEMPWETGSQQVVL